MDGKENDCISKNCLTNLISFYSQFETKRNLSDPPNEFASRPNFVPPFIRKNRSLEAIRSVSLRFVNEFPTLKSPSASPLKSNSKCTPSCQGRGVGYELDAIAAAVIGGTSLSAGGIGDRCRNNRWGTHHRCTQQYSRSDECVGLLAADNQGLHHCWRSHSRPAQAAR